MRSASAEEGEGRAHPAHTRRGNRGGNRGAGMRNPPVPANCTAIESAYPRLAEFRCLLNRRGVRAAPVLGGVARSAPPGPGSCLVQ